MTKAFGSISFGNMIPDSIVDGRKRSTCYAVPLLFFAVMGGIFTSVMPESRETLVQSMTVFAVTPRSTRISCMTVLFS